MYTLIAYKPESRHVVCGDVIDSWMDDINFHSYINEEQLVSLCAKYHGKKLGTHEVGYTLIVHTIIEGHLAFCEDLMTDDLVDERFFDIHHKVKAAIEKIKAAEEEEKRNQERIKGQNKVLWAEEDRIKKEKNERKEFERLKAIYGNQK